MKKKLIIIFIFISLIFLTGCNSELFADPNFSSDKIKFKNEIIINYKDDVDTTAFVDSVDDIKVKNENRNSKDRIITVNNYIIQCPDFKADKLGHFNLSYKFGDYEYTCSVVVKDIKSPTLTLKSKTYEITAGEKFDIDNVEIKTLKDNLTPKKKIKLELDGEYSTEKEGQYDLKIAASDEKNNKTEKNIKLIVYPAPSLTVEKDNYNLKTGQNETVKVTAIGKKADEISFSSSNNGIAAVDESGKITAKNDGNCQIIISCGNGLTKTVNVNVSSEEKNTNTNKNNNGTSNESSKNKTNNSKNPAAYNKYFSGNSIAVYNEAFDYAESILNSKKAGGYTLMPDGKGYNVTFY